MSDQRHRWRLFRVEQTIGDSLGEGNSGTATAHFKCDVCCAVVAVNLHARWRMGYCALDLFSSKEPKP